MPHDISQSALLERIQAVPHVNRRRLIALAGPPASGKSTMANRLADMLPQAAVVPMDGYHLDNAVLNARGLSARKGAPETFDVSGFNHLLLRLQTEEEVVCPLFDRELDRAIAGASVIGPETKTVVVEGNYLLLDAPEWRKLKSLWDFSVYLAVPEDELRRRLKRRWRRYGYTDEAAKEKIDGNDLLNASTISNNLLAADLTIEETRILSS